MPRFLEDFPREIRDQIYHYVLVSPTGWAILFPGQHGKHFRIRSYDNSDTKPQYGGLITLSLLSTCRQIHEETRDILLAENGVAFASPSHLLYGFRELPAALAKSIKRVEMRVCLTERHGLEATAKALGILGRWNAEGSLKAVTLNIAPEDVYDQSPGLREALIKLREDGEPVYLIKRGKGRRLNARRGDPLFQEYLSLLLGAGRGCCSSLERKLVLNTGWACLSYSGPGSRSGSSVESFCELVRELHDAWGGILSLDGVLCFKDHVEVGHLFELPT
jgi:hypothetical protein